MENLVSNFSLSLFFGLTTFRSLVWQEETTFGNASYKAQRDKSSELKTCGVDETIPGRIPDPCGVQRYEQTVGGG